MKEHQDLSQGGSVEPEKFYDKQQIPSIVLYLNDFILKGKVWTLDGFVRELDDFHKILRFRYTKGGHKTNQNSKIRHTFIC